MEEVLLTFLYATSQYVQKYTMKHFKLFYFLKYILLGRCDGIHSVEVLTHL